MEKILSDEDKAFYHRLKTSRTLTTELKQLAKSTAWEQTKQKLLEKSALACATKEKMYTEYTSNKLNLDTGYSLPNHDWDQYPDKSVKQYTMYTSREHLWRKIHSDSVFIQALGWAKHYPEGCKFWNSKIAQWYCLEFGFLFVKSAIQRVAGRHDYYFTGQGCIAAQRIKLCRHILDTEGVKIAHVS
jgi:hypothetical protein